MCFSKSGDVCCQKTKVSKEIVPKVFPDKIYKSVQPKGVDATGMTCECGVFGAIACGDYPTQVGVLNVLNAKDRENIVLTLLEFVFF